MKVISLVLAIAATVGQSGSAGFAGSWTAQFDGQTFIQLDLTQAETALKGGIALASFSVDKKGVVYKASGPLSAVKPISELQWRGSTVTFAVDGTDDKDRFELRLLDTGRAELTLLVPEEVREELAEQGIGAPQPIILTKR